MTDEGYMAMAIAAAMANLGRTAPNPTVGCVIVRDGVVLATGATAPGGSPHAEESAVPLAGEAARGATAYVTLEPCGARSSGARCCADHLIAAGVTRVVIACEDVSPLASGQGLERLRAAGVTVELGLLAEDADILSAGFRRRLATGMPIVEAASGPEGYDAAFEPAPGEDLEAALRRHGALGFNRLWAPVGGELADRMSQRGLLG